MTTTRTRAARGAAGHERPLADCPDLDGLRETTRRRLNELGRMAPTREEGLRRLEALRKRTKLATGERINSLLHVLATSPDPVPDPTLGALVALSGDAFWKALEQALASSERFRDEDPELEAERLRLWDTLKAIEQEFKLRAVDAARQQAELAAASMETGGRT